MNLRNRIIAFFVTMAMVLNNLLSPVSVWYGDRSVYAAEAKGSAATSADDLTASEDKTAAKDKQSTVKPGAKDTQAAAKDANAAASSKPVSTTPETAATKPAEPRVLKKTITAGKEPAPGEPDTRRTYNVQVTYDASAGIPEGAEIEVSELEANDARKNATRDRLKLGEHDRVVAETYLKVAIKAGGKEVQPTAPVEVVVETASMDPTYSDAVEAVVLGERDNAVTVENLTGRRDDGTEDEKPKATKLKLTTSRLGEFALATVVAPFDAWVYNGQTTTLLGPRNKQTAINEVLYDEQVADGKTLLRTVSFQTEPAHAWHPALWVESRLGEGHDAAAGAVSCWRWEDGRATAKVFGEAGTGGPVAIASEGEYAFALEQKQVAEGHTQVSEEATSEVGMTAEPAPSATTSQDPVQQTPAEAQVTGEIIPEERQSEEGQSQSAPVAQLEHSPKPNLFQPVVSQNIYVASDGRTYRVTASADETAGIPKGANLVVAEVAKGDAGYLGYLSQSAKALDVKATEVSFAKLLDISFKDPISGEEYQPSGDVRVTIELMGGEIDDAQGLGVVHFGDKVQPVAAAVRGDEVTFKADGFSVYAVVGYTVDFHTGDTTYSIQGRSSVALSKLLGELGITDVPLAEVADVVFSDPTLVRVDKQGGDWLLTSLKSFTTEEKLSIVLKSGRTVVVRVTDDEYVTVTFYDEDRTQLDTKQVVKGGSLGEGNVPAGPEVADCSFKGWYLDGGTAPIDKDTVFSDNTNVYARYSVTVTFTVDGEPTGDPKTFDKGTAIGELPTINVPEKHRFDGWHVAGKEDPITAATIFDANATATGSLVEQVTVTFKDGDATYGEPISIDKGTAIGVERFPTNPQHDNCRFDAWYVGESKVTAETQFTEDTTVTAKYLVDVTFNVDYETETGTYHYDQKVTLEKGVQIGASRIPQDPARTGYRFDGWYVSGADPAVKVDANTKFDENTMVDAVFVRQYTIKFVDEDGTTVIHGNDPVDEGTEIDPSLYKPEDKDKKRFDGWYDESENPPVKVTAAFEATGDRTLKARFVDVVTIIFMADEEEYRSYTPDKNSIQALPAENPQKSGYRFDGWYDESENPPVKVTAAFKATGDRTLTAHFVKQYTVKFFVDLSADPYASYAVDEGGSVSPWPADPTPPDYYRFDGWYEGDTKMTEVTNVTGDRVLTARFVEQVKLTYKVDGVEWKSEYKDKGERVGTLKQAPDKTDQGLHFMGWFTEPGGHHFTEDAVPEQDVTVAAKYGHRVTFKVNATDTAYVEDRIVEQNTSLGWLPGDPFKEGHTFIGWQLEGSESLADKDHVPTGDENYVAKFEPISLYTVIIKYVIENVEGVQETKTVVVADNDVAQKPVYVASPASYRTDSGVDVYPDQPTVIINSATLTQAHEGVVNITVMYKEPNATYHVKHMLKNLQGEGYTEVEDETKRGLQDAVVTAEPKEIANAEYERVGDSLKLTSDETQSVYAYYTRKSYTLIYDVNGGVGIKPVTAPFGSEVELPTPTREGYEFQGWYRDENLTQKIEGTTIVLQEDTTVYAKWEGVDVNYTIVYLFEKYDATGENPAYEYDNSETKTAKVGTTVRATDPGIPDKTRERWENDTAKNATSSVEIKADGSSVLNVYYKLKEYTFRFVSGGKVTYWFAGNWQYSAGYYSFNTDVSALDGNVSPATYISGELTSMTVKLGQRIASDWPLQYQHGRYYDRGYINVDFYGWRPNNGETSLYVTKRFTVTDDMLPRPGETTVTYTAEWLEEIGKTYTVNYFLQNADNDGYTKSTEYSQTYKSYSSGLSPKDIGGYSFVRRSDSGTTYNFYYNRDTYDIEYVYGSTTLKTIENVKFDANISGPVYNYRPANPADKPATEYSWGGWCIDEGLTSSYTFGKMPTNKLRLYAKWIPKTYTVQFRKNYPGATEDIPDKTVETGNTVSVDEPTRQYYTFEGWYTSATDCTSDTRFTDGGTQITASSPTTGNTKTIYANWTMNPLQYEVKYLDEVTGESLHMSKIRKSQTFVLGQTITENAISIPGFLPNMSSDSINLAYDPATNVITFKYSPKPAQNSYTVKYVVKGSNPEVYVRNPGSVTKNVNGSYETVTETALAPNVEAYKDYVPEETSIQKSLGTNQADNVITFNYVPNGAKVSISYVDMEGEEIKDPESGRYVVGSSFDLETDANGYVLDHIENNVGMGDTDTHYTVQSTADINIKIWFKKRLTIRADSKQEQWRKGISLTNESSPDNVTVEGLKNGHTLSGITLTGAQTQVGVGFSDPSDAKITGMKPDTTAEVDASQFYSISYRQGTLTLTKANVTIRVEPDRWTGNVYTGNEYEAGFSNTSKTRDDYIIISNDDYRDDYRDAIWNQLTANDTNKTLIAKTDAGDYTLSANDVRSKIQNLPTADGNYDVTLFVRECRLEIKPAQLSITTGSDSKTYDGEPLMKNELTLKVGNEDRTPSNSVYNLVKDDTATVRVTGSQLNAGTSLNTYEIVWGSNTKSDNYVITTESLGTLEVTPREIVITADDKEKPWGQSDPAFTVTVTEESTVIPNSLARWIGDSYTLKLRDDAHSHMADIPLTITRASGEELGEYAINVAQTSGTGSPNYIITTKPGKLTIAIARVSNDNGNTWRYHAYLINDGEGINQGAFDYAKTLTGNVIIETMLETHPHYTVSKGTEFNKANTNYILRTTQNNAWNPAPGGNAKRFSSKIYRGWSGDDSGAGTLLHINEATTALTTKNITLDCDRDGSATGTARTGRALYVTKGTLTIGEGTTLQNAVINGEECRGGAVYVSSNGTLTVAGVPNNHVSIANCQSSAGGAINTGIGANTYTGTINMSYCDFSYCSAVGTKDKDGKNAGGAFRSLANIVTIDHCTFTNCSSEAQGGSVFHQGTTSLTITNSNFSNSSAGFKADGTTPTSAAGFSAGALEAQKAGTVTVDACSFTDCKSSKNGGAVNVYNENASIEVSNSTFTRCYASTTGNEGNGGAIRNHGSQTTITNCTISDCRAKQGGGIYLNNGTLTFNSGTVNNCYASANGGGIFLNKERLVINGGTVSQCKTKGNGGGIYIGGGTLLFSNGTISECVGKTGGGIYANTDKAVTIAADGSDKAVTIEKCEAKNITVTNDMVITVPTTFRSENKGGGLYQSKGTLNISNAKVDSCAAYDGGGLMLASGNLNVNGATQITNNTASNYGGGVALGGGIFTINGVTNANAESEALISGNVAKRGGGIIVQGGAKANVYGGRVIQNRATVAGGGIAADADKNKTSEIFFQGDVQVYDNHLFLNNKESRQQCNVLLDHESAAIINTTDRGLSNNASIGIYVEGKMGSNETEPYKSYGGYHDDFGTYEGSDASKNNLGAFINDRNGMYGEVDSDKPGEKLIRWQNYLCKLTDSNGNLLRYKQGDVYRRAVFTTLQDAFDHAKKTLYVYDNDGSGNEYAVNRDINLEMLMDYTQPASDLATMEAPRKLTMKTANTDVTANPAYDEGTVDVYIYDKNGDDNVDAGDRRATITRGANGQSMLTVDNASSKLTIMNLVLDGNRDAGYESSTEGGIVWAKQGALRLTSDTSSSSKYATNGSYGGNSYDEARDVVLCNSLTNQRGGGAVKVGTGSTNAGLTMDGHAQILNCTARHGGGIHVGESSGGSSAVVGGNAVIQECTASDGYGGGIFVHNATATVKDSAQIDDCSANSRGGGINVGWAESGTSQTRKLTITGNAQITNCSAPYGGGVNVENTFNEKPNVAEISGSVTISGCAATTQGGAINVEGGAHVTSTGASMTNNTAPEGAAIALIGAATYHMGSDKVTGNLSTANPGGAIAVKSAEGRIAFEGAPLVYGNFNRVTHQQQNVVLEHNSNLVINAGALTGSNATGSIVGIYVTGTMADNEANDTTPFAEHGREGEPFGTYDANGSGTDTTKLGVFVNDRIASLAGSKGTNGKEIVWAPADKVPFAVTKTWSHLDENGDYTTLDADDPEIRNRTVYFELYKVTGGSGGAVIDNHGTNLPNEMLRNMDDVLPMDEISKVEEAVKTDPSAQSTTITFKPTHGFYYYSGSHTEWRWNSETSQNEQVTVDDTGWYIIFLDYSNNYTQVWVEGQNGEPGHLNNGLFESQSAGVKYSGNIYNYDTDRATDTTHFRWDDARKDYWPQNIGKGDIVIYNSKYYVVWNQRGAPFSEWTEGQFGGNWFYIGDVGKMSIPSSKPVIDYATQEAAEAEEGKHEGSISGVTINPSDALIPGTASSTEEVTIIEDGQPTRVYRQVFKIDYSDPNWTKIIPNLDANASYYVVERKITDYERNEDGSIKLDAAGNPVLTELAIKHNSYDRNGVFTVGYSYSQAGDAATIDNLTDEGQAGTEIGFTKVDGFGVPLANNVNATFELYAMNASGTVDQSATAVTLTVGPEDDQTNDTRVTSGSGGVVKFTVANGIYVMRETSVPSGYATSADEWAVVAGSEYMTAEQLHTVKPKVFDDITNDQLTAQTNAQMDATAEQDQHEKGYAIFRLSSADSNGIRKALAAPDITRYGLMNASVTQRKVILRKVGTKALDSNGNPTTPFERLAGAEFTLYEADWAVREEGITSDESGLSLIENLPVGTYYLLETKAPNDSAYAGNVDRRFKLVVKEDGNSIEALASDWEPTKQVVITAGAGSAAGSAKTETTNRYYIADADGNEITAANVPSYHGGDQVAFQLMCQATVRYATTPTTQERTETREPYKVDSAVWSASSSATIDAGGMATFDEVESSTEVTVSAATMPNSDVAVASATVSVNPSTYAVVLDPASATYAAGSTATAKLMKNSTTEVTGVTWNLTAENGGATTLARIESTGLITFSNDIEQPTTFKVTATYNGKTFAVDITAGPDTSSNPSGTYVGVYDGTTIKVYQDVIPTTNPGSGDWDKQISWTDGGLMIAGGKYYCAIKQSETRWGLYNGNLSSLDNYGVIEVTDSRNMDDLAWSNDTTDALVKGTVYYDGTTYWLCHSGGWGIRPSLDNYSSNTWYPITHGATVTIT